jgi:hypothetical protein
MKGQDRVLRTGSKTEAQLFLISKSEFLTNTLATAPQILEMFGHSRSSHSARNTHPTKRNGKYARQAHIP